MPKIIALALVLFLIGTSASWAQNQQTPPQQADVQAAMTAQAENIIADAAQSAGLLTSFGNPAWVMESGKNRVDVLVEFQHGPLPDLAAAEFGMIACARLAQNYVVAKAPVRRLGVTVTSPLPDGRMRVYGTAIYNGNLAALIWENAGLNLDTAAAPKVPADAKARATTEKPVISQAQKPQAAANARPKANPPVAEEVIEEEVVVIQPQAPQAQQQGQAAPQQQAAPKQKQIQQYPNDLTPGAIRPKPKKSQESPCPYVQGLANPESRPVPPAPGMNQPRGPQTGCPYLDGKIPGMVPPPPGAPRGDCPYLQGKMPELVPAQKPGPQVNCPYLQGIYNSKKKNAPDNRANSAINVNPAEQSYEVMAQNILNVTSAELGLQDIFGNPAYSLEATDRQANMMVQFRQGPLPEEAAIAYGLSACENLARAYVVKGLGIKKFALTVTCLLPNGGMNIYGTAVFNGNIEDIKWQNAGLVVNPGPGQPPVPPLPYISQPNSPDGQAVQRRPLNVQRAPQNLKPSMPPAKQNQAPNTAPNVAQQPVEKAAPQQQSPIQEQQKQLQAPEQQKPAPDQPATESLKENALDNANEANHATYSFEARQIINHAVRAIGLQSTYGIPEYSVIAGDKKADISIIFKRGPMPDASAASFGLMACEQLARACIIKGFGTRYLGVTVCYIMPDGRRYDYGTAIFNGNLDDLSWVVVDRII